MHAFKLSLVTGVAAVALFALSGTAQAAPGDTIRSGFTCTMFLPEVPSASTTDSLLLTRPSGSMTLVCRFQSTNPSGSAIVLTGFPCTAVTSLTRNSQYTLTAGGHARLPVPRELTRFPMGRRTRPPPHWPALAGTVRVTMRLLLG